MMPLFISFQFVDFVDIFLVALLMYEIYKLIRGTAGMNVFLGIIAFYVIWLVVRALHMEMLTRIFGQFISIGGLALVILFQTEIRRFLTMVGNRYLRSQGRKRLAKFLNVSQELVPTDAIPEISNALFTMAESKTGALIVIAKNKETILSHIQTGELIESRISSALLQNIFYKNTPLHDGAVVIVGRKIIAAKCMLPMSKKLDLPLGFGMRHRSAMGMSEETDTLTLVVSEQTGDVSYFLHGEYFKLTSPEQVETLIKQRQGTL
ncbi:MAG: diadenylate cyclase CdaA [Bacteroidales bacterium]|nr:diadenylate cyclase CdaA [Bacteroidales bacterium]